MTDIVFFAGPVAVHTAAFESIPWRRPTVVIPIQGSGSSYFAQLAEQLRSADGRILPALLQRYASGVPEVDKIALCAYSAGHGLLDRIFQVAEDRERINASVVSDATFSGLGAPPKEGYVQFGSDAANGRRLFVSTTANTTDGTHQTGRDSWLSIWREIELRTGKVAHRNPREGEMPEPSGGVWGIGTALTWYDYADAAGHSDMTHGEHHSLAAATWSAYLVPYFGGIPSWVLGGALAAAGGAGALYLRQSRGG